MSVGGKAPRKMMKMTPLEIDKGGRKFDLQADQPRGPRLISKKPFAKLVEEISRDFKPKPRFDSIAMLGLTEASEAFLVKLFHEAHLCTMHGKKISITPEDIKLARRLRGERA